jgi:hypothetical protein
MNPGNFKRGGNHEKIYFSFGERGFYSNANFTACFHYGSDTLLNEIDMSYGGLLLYAKLYFGGFWVHRFKVQGYHYCEIRTPHPSCETTHVWNSEPQNFDIRHSLFDIRYLSASGGFAFSAFLFRLNWPLRLPAAKLNPEPLNA